VKVNTEWGISQRAQTNDYFNLILLVNLTEYVLPSTRVDLNRNESNIILI
jgi:hypothetical protein